MTIRLDSYGECNLPISNWEDSSIVADGFSPTSLAQFPHRKDADSVLVIPLTPIDSVVRVDVRNLPMGHLKGTKVLCLVHQGQESEKEGKLMASGALQGDEESSQVYLSVKSGVLLDTLLHSTSFRYRHPAPFMGIPQRVTTLQIQATTLVGLDMELVGLPAVVMAGVSIRMEQVLIDEGRLRESGSLPVIAHLDASGRATFYFDTRMKALLRFNLLSQRYSVALQELSSSTVLFTPSSTQGHTFLQPVGEHIGLCLMSTGTVPLSKAFEVRFIGKGVTGVWPHDEESVSYAIAPKVWLDEADEIQLHLANGSQQRVLRSDIVEISPGVYAISVASQTTMSAGSVYIQSASPLMFRPGERPQIRVEQIENGQVNFKARAPSDWEADGVRLTGLRPGVYNIFCEWDSIGSRLLLEAVTITAGEETVVPAQFPTITRAAGHVMRWSDLSEDQRPIHLTVEGASSRVSKEGTFSIQVILPWPSTGHDVETSFRTRHNRTFSGVSDVVFENGELLFDAHCEGLLVSAFEVPPILQGVVSIEYSRGVPPNYAGGSHFGTRFRTTDHQGSITLPYFRDELLTAWAWEHSGGKRTFRGWIGSIGPANGQHVQLPGRYYGIDLKLSSIAIGKSVELALSPLPGRGPTVLLGHFTNGLSTKIWIPTDAKFLVVMDEGNELASLPVIDSLRLELR